MKKTVIIFFIFIFFFFAYQAVVHGISSVRLSDANYYLYQNTRNGLTEEQFVAKMEEVLSEIRLLDKNNPQYHEILAGFNLWRATASQSPSAKQVERARQHYRLALGLQPHNPYLWKRLAETNLIYSDVNPSLMTYSIMALDRAAYYGSSDKNTMLDVVLWKIPLWSYLEQRQKQALLAQVYNFVKIKKNENGVRQVEKSLKASGQKRRICSRLPRSDNFKALCD